MRIDFHKQSAKASGRSLAEPLRHVLAESALAPRQNFGKRVKQRLARLRAKFGVMPNSTAGIRAEHDRRA